MRPDHTIAEYSASHSALPVVSPETTDDESPDARRPLARVTFCFAWLFGLEPFLTGGAGETQRPGTDRRA